MIRRKFVYEGQLDVVCNFTFQYGYVEELKLKLNQIIL